MEKGWKVRRDYLKLDFCLFGTHHFWDYTDTPKKRHADKRGMKSKKDYDKRSSGKEEVHEVTLYSLLLGM